MVWRSLLLGGAALLATAPVAAQNQDVVVTGRLADPAAARHFVASITDDVEGQLSRFKGPICPNVIGVTGAPRDQMIRRIREIAEQAGIATAPADCVANVSIIFTPEPGALIESLRARTPSLFASTDLTDVNRLIHGSDPARAWFLTEVRNEDGTPAQGAAPMKGNDSTRTVTVRTASIVRQSVQQVTLQAFVVIDQGAVMGKKLTQIVDYAAMRALGRVRSPRDGVAGSTILTLFDAGATAPDRLTFLDMAFLRALYQTAPTLTSNAQRESIASRLMAKGAD